MTSLADIIAKGIERPKVETVIYLDQEALYAFGAEEDDDKKIELKKQVEASGLTFELQGLPRAAVNAVVRSKTAKISDEDERADAINIELLTRSITSIKNASGELVSSTDDSIKDFLSAIPQQSFLKLVTALNQLEFDSLRHEDELTDPTLS